MYIEKKNIALCIIFSLLTCGIYGLFWLASMADSVNRASNRTGDTSGGLVVLFSILTCNIYHVYWCYKAGEKIDEARQIRGQYVKNSGIIYLLLTLFGLSIVTWALLQNELNELAEA